MSCREKKEKLSLNSDDDVACMHKLLLRFGVFFSADPNLYFFLAAASSRATVETTCTKKKNKIGNLQKCASYVRIYRDHRHLMTLVVNLEIVETLLFEYVKALLVLIDGEFDRT